MVETIYHFNIPISIALLGDTHGIQYSQMIDCIKKNKPHIICICGDIIVGTQPISDNSPLKSQTNVLPFLRECANICPTILSLGNHDWCLDGYDLADIRTTGVILLDNSFICIDLENIISNDYFEQNASNCDNKLVIGGLTSGYVTDYRQALSMLSVSEKQLSRYPNRSIITYKLYSGRKIKQHEPDTSWLSSFTACKGYHVLLSHEPENIQFIPKEVQCVLSAHCHGGQWRYYSLIHREWRGLYSPSQGFFPKYSSGIYGNMIVSRGLANTSRIPRIFNEPEVVFIRPYD